MASHSVQAAGDAALSAAPGDLSPGDLSPGEQLTMYGVPCVCERGQTVLFANRDEYLEVLALAAADGFEMCVDLCAVDSLTHSGPKLPPGIEPERFEPERFEVVVNLLDLRGRRRLRVRTQVPADDPQLPSAVGLYPGVDAPEREAADLFGISFSGHPDPSRILMPPDWDGHPLRKDYAIGAIPVQFKALEGR